MIMKPYTIYGGFMNHFLVYISVSFVSTHCYSGFAQKLNLFEHFKNWICLRRMSYLKRTSCAMGYINKSRLTTVYQPSTWMVSSDNDKQQNKARISRML